VTWAAPTIAVVVLLYATFSKRLDGTPVTGAMVFTAAGLLVGSKTFDVVNLDPRHEAVKLLAEATLAAVLFGDAARINLRALRGEYLLPARLLGIGLPLTIVAGLLAALVLFGSMAWPEALVLAVVLAPTDAALGQAVVTLPSIPSRIRQGLNVESGLNDGICVPLLLIALAVADIDEKTVASHHAISIVIEEIGYGIVGGLAAGLAAAAIIRIGSRRDLIAGPWLQVIPIAGAALAYGVAAALGGSGFIAAFLAGGVFGALAAGESEPASRLNEEIGGLLGGLTFLMFGAVLLGPALKHATWQAALYAVLSLTVVRMLPVAIALLGTSARRETVCFLGWFGPRGLATIVFAVLTVQEAHLAGSDTILLTAYVTVGLSVFAHGITASPLAHRYARWYEAHRHPRRSIMESVPAPHHRARGRRSP
jgi:NhaP-type Na+/H+ or K+/H+ antiporter